NDDDAKGAAKVLVLSHAAWREHFSSDPAIVGRRIHEPYGGTEYTIVGVAPPGLDYPSGAGYYIPVWEGDHQVLVVARLTSGATIEQARNEFFQIAKRLKPDWNFRGATAIPFEEAVVGDVRPVLTVLLASVALLLLIACVNVGSLVLLRAASRQRELAIRRAIGARASDIVRPLLGESAVIAVAGGLAGIVAARWLLTTLLTLAPTEIPRAESIRISGVPLGLGLAITCFTLLLFGVAPAILAARRSELSPLQLGTRSGSDTRERRRARQGLVAAQVALAMVMLAGAGLLVRSLTQLQSVQLGYAADHLSVVQIAFPAARYDTISKLGPMGEALVEKWRATPGVISATPTLLPPFLGANIFRWKLDREGASQDEAERTPLTPIEVGGGDYFATMGIPIVRGRAIAATDRENAPRVVVISTALARRTFGSADPIGKRMGFTGDSTSWRTVVGVAGDIRYRSLREDNPTAYLPFRQSFWQGAFAVRTRGELRDALPELRESARAIDPQLSLWEARSMDELLAAPLARPKLAAFLLSGFGVTALLLAAIGLYGVMASSVREQPREIGVRMALGATRERLRAEVLGSAWRIMLVGALIGVVGALASARLYATLLYGVRPVDPLSLAASCAVLVGVGVLAAWIPARRAMRVQPAEVLRAE
ncbi:MAG: ADOP family duplicated permease, partial [Gemmatimonadaceae bacterium]